jgi:phosphatidylglycerophosphatase A
MSRAAELGKWLLATCGGFGYSPILPGTCGALWGVAIYVPLGIYVAEPWQSAFILLALVLSCAVTFWLSRWAEVYFGEEDSGRFVTDEVAGFLFTVLLFRTSLLFHTSDVLTTVLWAFPATRIIDMIKIPPARRLEYLPGGWGVLADDLLGSVYAAALLHLVAWAYPRWFGG